MNEAVHALVERYDPWTGRAWLEVRGRPSRVVPIGPGYAEQRDALRRAWPDRPFDADWSDGHFASSPFGLPPYPVLVVAWAVSVAAVGAAAAAAGVGAAAVVVLGCSWPIARLSDSVHVGPRGVRVGPPWALTVPWHEVEAMGAVRIGRSVQVWLRGRRGGATATLPPVLLPALRARVRRLGALEMAGDDGGLDVRYARYRAAAAGLPWGVLAASLAVAPFLADPWRGLGTGLLVVAALALTGAAVEARATGWRVGAVGWLTLVHALVLAALTIGSWTR